MKISELPKFKQCMSCEHLHCGHIRMNDDNDYWCDIVICFWKYKEDNCKQYKEGTAYGQYLD